MLDTSERGEGRSHIRGDPSCNQVFISILSSKEGIQEGANAQGSASFMASVGSALLCSLLASFSAEVSCKSIL